jgi:hypothetical protein
MKRVSTLTIALVLLTSISISLKAQRLDTVLVRNLTMQAQDWAYCIGSMPQVRDSATYSIFRKIRSKFQSSNVNNWSTNVTVDSLPGSILVAWYQIVQSAPAKEIFTRYSAITNAIQSKINISYWVGAIDGIISSNFDKARNQGKAILLDN